MLVLACLDETPPASPSACVQQVWVEQPSLLPPLSIPDAQDIASTFLLSLAGVMAVKLLLKAT